MGQKPWRFCMADMFAPYTKCMGRGVIPNKWRHLPCLINYTTMIVHIYIYTYIYTHIYIHIYIIIIMITYYISMMLSAIPNSKCPSISQRPRVAHRVRLIVALLAVHLSRQDRRTRHHQRFQAVGHGELDQQHPNGLDTVARCRVWCG